LAAISRPLIFASLQPEIAEAKGVSLRLIAVLFLAIVAIAVAESSQIVGVLLVFALMDAWGGLTLAFYTDWPVSFWIAALSGAVYFAALLMSGSRFNPLGVIA